MAKALTFPIIYDELVTISTTLLNRANLFAKVKGSVVLEVSGYNSFSIGVFVNQLTEHPHAIFIYRYHGELIKFHVELVKVDSNLGKGVHYFFVCPKSNKRCRKLILFNGQLMHRSCINGFYRSQTYSKKDRKINKFITKYYKEDEVCEQIFKRYFKTHYRGKVTKRLETLLHSIGKKNLEEL